MQLSAGLKRYLNNTSWMFLGSILKMVLAFFVGVIVARYLGPKDFGLLNYAMSVVGILGCLAGIGTDEVVVRELVKNRGEVNDSLGSAFFLRQIGAWFVLLGLGVALFIFNAEPDPIARNLILIMGSIFLFRSLEVIEMDFRSTVEAEFTSKVSLITAFTLALIKVGMVYLKAPLTYFGVAYVLDGVLVGAGYLFLYFKRRGSVFSWRPKRKKIGGFVRSGWPLLISALATTIYMQVDQVMLRHMVGPEELGRYSVAVRISSIYYFIPVIMTNSLFPALIAAKERDHNLYVLRLKLLYEAMMPVALAFIIPISLLAFTIISILFGDKYLGAAAVLQVHVWAGFPVFWGTVSSKYLIAEDMENWVLIRTIYGAIANVILNIILIPEYGIVGAAWATVISYYISTFSIGLNQKARSQCAYMLQSVFLVNIIGKLKQRLLKGSAEDTEASDGAIEDGLNDGLSTEGDDAGVRESEEIESDSGQSPEE